MKYLVTGPSAQVSPGTVVNLSKAQAAARVHALLPKGDFWVATAILTFKAGETIDLPFVDPEALPRSVAANVTADGVEALAAADKKRGRK